MTILISITVTAIVSFVAGAVYGRRAEQAVIAEIVALEKGSAERINLVWERVKHLF